jgi:hypothetical protein
VTPDLLDTTGRLVRLAIAAAVAAGASVLFVFTFASIIYDEKTGATRWFAIATAGMVFVPTTMAVNALLARIPTRERRAKLPVARLLRR